MRRRMVLTNGETDDGIMVEFDTDVVSAAELQAEIIKLVHSPKVKTLSDEDVEDLIREYDGKMDRRVGREKQDAIRSLLYAAKAYWDEQGIDQGNTDDVVREINRLHPEWNVRREIDCTVFTVWD